MKIVILDGCALNMGVADPWSRLGEFGEWVMYETTPQELLAERAQDADILVINKAPIDAGLLERLPRLKLIAVTAAGTNVVDLKAAGERGIPVCNTPAYGTDAVAQHVFALLLELCRHTALHTESVRRGDWRRRQEFCYWLTPQIELTGKTLGIFGFGDLGRRVAEIGHAFRMKVIACAHRPMPKPGYEPFEFVSREELFRCSDVLSLHCPLTAETRGLVCAETLALMKNGSLLINTSRGPVVSDKDVADALNSGHLAGFAADVLEEEPPQDDDPLLTAPNVLLTPHIAWATSGAMSNIAEITAENIRRFLAGNPQNVVNAALLKRTAAE
ncbi:D-2-hydroxyacid dehydrogenase [uncultured Mailhella sp.]|uniref:D-2-hydroxyacid dehydrogenase n=1 Tax=uncultured Mailhella sp. TaxID=1981031 RepID=UPI0026369DA6|nr:D-2-hydroxyacid dehydrogenase [uncultured Mailhella sp.]